MRSALVVDDSAMMRSILKKALVFAGVGIEEISEAKNGAVALEMIAAQRPALVLCDVNMPVLDGFGFLEALGANGLINTIPVVMVTSRQERSSVSRLLELGAREVIAKPFETHRIHERIRAYLPDDPVALPMETGHERALVDAVISTFEQVLFCCLEENEPSPMGDPHIVAELDISNPAGTLFMASTCATGKAMSASGDAGVAATAELLAELLNIVAGDFRTRIEISDGHFGLPRTRIAANGNPTISAAVHLEVRPGQVLRVGFVQRVETNAGPNAEQPLELA